MAAYQKVTVRDKVPEGSWLLEELFRVNKLGSDLKWQIGFDAETEELVTFHGHVEGEIQEDRRKVEINNSGRNISDQAWLEAKAKYVKSIRKGYATADGIGENKNITVMASKLYVGEDEEGKKKTKLKFPVDVEPKYNGTRGYSQIRDGEVFFMSRSNVQHINMEHIIEELTNLMPYLPSGSIIDGEIWHPTIPFEDMNSLIKNKKSKSPAVVLLIFMIHDLYIPANPPSEVRRELMEKSLRCYRKDFFNFGGGLEEYGQGGILEQLFDNRTIEEVEVKKAVNKPISKIFISPRIIVHSEEEIAVVHGNNLSQGYEGSMIKKRANGAEIGTSDYKKSQYIFNRGDNTLKLKPKLDEEAICVGVTEGKGREKGCVLLELKDKRGNLVTVRPKGNMDRRKDLFQCPDQVIGKRVTVEFQCFTKYNVWSFPVVVAIRDYEPVESKMKIIGADEEKKTIKVVRYDGSSMIDTSEFDVPIEDDEIMKSISIGKIVVIDFFNLQEPIFLRLCRSKIVIKSKK